MCSPEVPPKSTLIQIATKESCSGYEALRLASRNLAEKVNIKKEVVFSRENTLLTITLAIALVV